MPEQIEFLCTLESADVRDAGYTKILASAKAAHDKTCAQCPEPHAVLSVWRRKGPLAPSISYPPDESLWSLLHEEKLDEDRNSVAELSDQAQQPEHHVLVAFEPSPRDCGGSLLPKLKKRKTSTSPSSSTSLPTLEHLGSAVYKIKGISPVQQLSLRMSTQHLGSGLL